MKGVGDMSWDNGGDVVDIDEEECWRNNTPCVIPSLIFTLSLRCPSTFTRADLSWRKQRIHLNVRPDTPVWSTLRSNTSLHTLSKALDRS